MMSDVLIYLKRWGSFREKTWSLISDPSHEGNAGNYLGGTIRPWKYMKLMCPERDSNLGVGMIHGLNYKAATLTTQPTWMEYVNMYNIPQKSIKIDHVDACVSHFFQNPGLLQIFLVF